MEQIEKHLLYLEDDLNIAEVNIKILSLIFKNVTHASNGLEGLEAYHIHKFDLILSDIQMPIMDGIEFIETIREMDEEIPIYVYSSMMPSSFPKHLNIIKIFQKPYGMKDFLKLFSTTF